MASKEHAGGPDYIREADMLRSEICDRVFDDLGGRGVVEWNDEPGRTEREVVSLLRTGNAADSAQVKRKPWRPSG